MIARCLFLAAALAVSACVAAPSPEAPVGRSTVTVRVSGSLEPGATVVLALYSDAESFDGDGEPARGARLAVEAAEVVWQLDPLPYGTYAVKAFLDTDGDGELGRGALGAPTEPYGFSRRARGRFGPPAFAAAAFQVRTPALEIEIALE